MPKKINRVEFLSLRILLKKLFLLLTMSVTWPRKEIQTITYHIVNTNAPFVEQDLTWKSIIKRKPKLKRQVRIN